MKTNSLQSLERMIPCVGSLLLGLTALCLAGCASANYQKGDAAANSLERAAGEVQAEGRVLDLTLASLKELYQSPGPDLKQPFQHYSACLDRLMAAAHRTDLTGQEMARKNTAYLQAWEKQTATIDYEHIRNLSQARMLEVSNRFAVVNRRYSESQAAVQPTIGYLLDLRRALSSDLTPEGLASMKGIVENAETNASKVQTALGALSAELADSGNHLSSIAYQPREQQSAEVPTAVSRR